MNPIKPTSSDAVERTGISRRNFIGTAASGLIASAVSSSGVAGAAEDGPKDTNTETKSAEKKSEATEHKLIRWGFVGTGGIANKMAGILKLTPAGELAASSSRTMAKAEAFATKYGSKKAFDSWKEMIDWDGIDAVYVATPTSVREEICIAAAKAGKHVLGEKPFASLASVQRITKACQENNVAFMDGTHFSHHPRTSTLGNELNTLVGKRRRVDSVFQFRLGDPTNIRFNPKLEPMGAIGDAGWYNMRAIVDFLDPSVKLKLSGVSAHLRRDPENGAVIGATGVIAFEDGSVSTWSCGFDAGAGRAGLSIDGKAGAIDIENFIRQDKDNSASYRYRSRGGKKKSADKVVRIESPQPGAALMFEDFSAQVHDPSLRDQWKHKSERTQELLDAAWASAIANEQP